MAKHFKKFKTTAEYEEYILSDNTIFPNVTVCEDRPLKVYYNKHIKNKMFYTSTNGEKVTPYNKSSFGSTIDTNIYRDGKGVYIFNGEITSIGENAFLNRDRLKSINIPNTVTNIGKSAFESCIGLESIEITSSITSINKYAFYGCTNLSDVNLPSSITVIEDNTFQNCTGLNSVKLPSSVTNIKSLAFNNCYNLTSIKIPSTIEKIGDYSFSECSGLSYIIIEKETPFEIGSGAFYNTNECPIYVYGGAESAAAFREAWPQYAHRIFEANNFIFYTSIDESVVTPFNEAAFGANIVSNTYDGGKGVIEFDNNVQYIGEQAFYGCDKLESLNIPGMVDSIKSSAFTNCEKLSTIDIHSGITEIGNYAFYGCKGLTELTLLEQIETLGDYAFAECDSLNGIYCKNVSAFTIQETTFDNTNECPIYTYGALSMKNYKANWAIYADRITPIQLDNEIYYTTSDNRTVSINTSDFDTTIKVHEYSNGFGFIIFNNTLTYIGQNAIRYNNKLTSVKIPNSVTLIKYQAFYICSALTMVQIPDSVTTIERDGFYGAAFSSVTISENLTNIGYYAFGGNKQLKEIICLSLVPATIDNSFEDTNNCPIKVPSKAIMDYINSWPQYEERILPHLMGNELFYSTVDGSKITPNEELALGSPIVENIYFEGMGIIITENDIISIADNAFSNNDKLTKVELADKVNSIGNNAFANCTSLENIRFNDNLNTIGNRSFENCTSLETLTIYPELTNIGNGAFSGCSELFEITIIKTTPSIQNLAFDNGNDCPIYVPVTSVNDYINSWPEYAERIQESSRIFLYTTIDDNSVSMPSSGETILYNKNGYLAFENDITILNNTFNSSKNLQTIQLHSGLNSIGDSAFTSCENLLEIDIHSGITTLGKGAFKWCSGLTEVIIPDSVTTIDLDAFAYCYSLTGLTIPESVTNINPWGLCYRCYSLKEVKLCSSLNTIGNGMFCDCRCLKEVNVPSAVTLIQSTAFNGCSGLTALTFNSKVPPTLENQKMFDSTNNCPIYVPFGSVNTYRTNWSDYAARIVGFQNPNEIIYKTNDGLSVYLRDSGSTTFGANLINDVTVDNQHVLVFDGPVTMIGDNAFYLCSGLTSIELPFTVTSIGSYAFRECYNLTGITIPEGVTNIENSAFYYCYNLTGITIPEGVTNIGGYAFYNCSSLTGITIPEGVTNIGIYAFYNCSSLTGITIPEGVTNIGDSAFGLCSGLTECHIGSGITNINQGTFSGCTSLTGITIPEGVTNIGNYAFIGCSNLTGITIPDDVTSIGNYCFYNCSGLTGITIPEGVTNIGGYAFYNCSSLTGIITIPEGVTSIGDNTFYKCSSLTGITIPESITSIGSHTFHNCSSLTGITIPDSVTSIGSHTFHNCSSLTGITIPDSVTSINTLNLFTMCDSLEEVELCNSISAISTQMFSYCTSLKYIRIPINVKIIENAFASCNSLQAIEINCPAAPTLLSNSVFDSSNNCPILIPKEYIDNYKITPTFDKYADRMVENPSVITYSSTDNEIINPNTLSGFGCNIIYNLYNSGRGVILFDDSVINIPENAFKNNLRLKSIVLSDAVLTIDNSAFEGCIALNNINLPNGLVYLGENAFNGCSSLTDITCNNAYVTPYMSGMFDNTNECPITVPNESGEKYKRDWIEYKHRITFDSGITEYAIYYTSSTNAVINPKTGPTPKSAVTWGANIISNTYIDGIGKITFNGPVTGIADYAFSGVTVLKTITIPNTVRKIGTLSFYGAGLNSLELPDSVGYISESSLRNLSSATTIKLSPFIREIPTAALRANWSLKTLEIPDSVITIGASGLSNTTGGTEIIIGEGLTYLGPYAFNNSETNIRFKSKTPPTFVSGANPNTIFTMGPKLKIYVPEESVDLYKSKFGTNIAKFIEPYSPVPPVPPPPPSNNEIWYVSNAKLNYAEGSTVFGPAIVSHEYTSPNGIITLENDATKLPSFARNTNLQEFIIPETVESIPASGFSGCTRLTAVTIGAKEIGPYSFLGINSQSKSALTVVFKNTVQTIGRSAFNKINFNGLNLVSGLTKIDMLAFAYSSGITSVVIPDTVTEIGYSAFTSCSGLSSVVLGKSLTKLGAGAFANCRKLEKVECLAETPPAWSGTGTQNSFFLQAASNLQIYVKGVRIANIYKNTMPWSRDANKIVASQTNKEIWYTTSDGQKITSIDPSGFDANILYEGKYNDYFVIEFDAPITKIGENTFKNSFELTSIILPSEVDFIGDSAFQNCGLLTDISFNSNITHIGNSAFQECSSLVSINLPDSVNTIGESAFQNCGSLANIQIPSAITVISNSTFKNCDEISAITFSDSITSIGDSAFEGCTGLTNVIFSNSINNIGNSAFKRCVNLGNLILRNGITSIGDSAFEGCTGLTNVIFSNSINNIGNSAFKGCTGLISFDITDNINSIGENAFNGCTGLTQITSLSTIPIPYQNGMFDNTNDCPIYTIYVDIYKTAWPSYEDRIILPNNMIKYETINNRVLYPFIEDGFESDIMLNVYTDGQGYMAFNGSIGEIPETAFFKCYGLKSIELPNGTTSIGKSAFEGCYALENGKFANTLSNMDITPFNDCKKIESLTFLSTTPPYCDATPVIESNEFTIYVPEGSVDSYKYAWPEYVDRIQPIP